MKQITVSLPEALVEGLRREAQRRESRSPLWFGTRLAPISALAASCCRLQTDALSPVYEALRSWAEFVSLRGDGTARFVFVRHQERSAEVSVDAGTFWIEGWDSDDEAATDSAVEKRTVASVVEAIEFLDQFLAYGPLGPHLTRT